MAMTPEPRPEVVELLTLLDPSTINEAFDAQDLNLVRTAHGAQLTPLSAALS